MYKRALTVLLTAHLLFLAGFLCLGQMEEIQRNLQIKVPVAADSESRMIGIASRTSSGQRVVDCNELQRNSRYHLDMAELEVLLKIVEAEAGCEDEEGKLLVANVILNRLNSDKFPDSYTLVDNKVYYRENSIMKPVDMTETMQERIKGMVGIRNCTQELINLQLEEYSDSAIKEKQAELNTLYDVFSKKFGLINSQTNKRAFNQDSSYCLLCSLEKLDDEGNFKGKADMFTKRTIKKAEVVTSVDTASEALAVSLSEKAGIDLDYMAGLLMDKADYMDSEKYDKMLGKIKEELTGIIFQNPVTDRWETADEYLSGNVRDKLEIAKVYAENHPEYAVNVQALTQVQPKELDASEIEVRIGATWIDPKYIEDFMRDTIETPHHLFDRNIVGIQYSDVTGQWNVKGKNADYGNALVNVTYGTSRRAGSA